MGTTRIAKAWGYEIKTRRTSKEFGPLTQTQLAELLSTATHTVSQRAVSAWEKGQTVPHPEVQGRLIAVLGIDPVTLYRIYRSAA